MDTINFHSLPNGHTGDLEHICFSYNGERLITAAWDGSVKIWDATSLKLLHTINIIKGYCFSGVDFRNLVPDSVFSEEDKTIIKAYGGFI